jgi:sugar lactone lactonase YvrE
MSLWLACGGRTTLGSPFGARTTGGNAGGGNSNPGVGGTVGTSDGTGVLKLVAGTLGGPGDLDGVGSAARFRHPFGVTTDRAGHLFVTDQESHVVRQIDLGTGAVTTLAGSPGVQGSTDGSGAAARFSGPTGIAADGSGNLFVADTGNDTIRKIVVATGAVTTLAGSAGALGSNDGLGATARFSAPVGLASDGSGNLFVADSNNNAIRKLVIATGAVTTLAGSAGSWGSADGTGSAARFSQPSGVAADGTGNLFVADTMNELIRRIDLATGVVTTIAGLFASSAPPGIDHPGPPGVAGSADGIGQEARFANPIGITSDGAGHLFVADLGNGEIRSIVIATGLVTTLAGFAAEPSGNIDGVGTLARFYWPTGVVSDGAGNLFVADSVNHTIRKIVLTTREVSTFAGLPEDSGSTDSIGGYDGFDGPQNVASDGEGNLWVADGTLRKVVVATGAVTLWSAFPASYGSIAADGLGNLFVADADAIYKVVIATGADVLLAGSSYETGTTDGIGAAARFAGPSAMACDGAGSLFVVDSGNYLIRKVDTATGAVTTLAGLARAGGSSDGIGAVVGTAALFFNSMGLATDDSGNLFVADTGNSTIRKIVIATGQVTTLAGSAASSGSADGMGGSARFDHPVGIVCDKKGNLFVGDVNNHTIRKIVIATQEVTTVVGTPGRMGVVLGRFPAGLSSPTGLAFGPSGELLIADSAEHAILAAWF